jgi:hypothetical protein
MNLTDILANHQLKENVILYCDTGKTQQKYYLLAKAAFKYLPTPSTQVASEQLHSTVGNVVI